MSHVTDLLILVGNTPRETKAALEELGFVNVAKHGGGSKCCQGDVWLVSLNYYSEENQLRKTLSTLHWHTDNEKDWEKSTPKFFIQHEHDSNWHTWTDDYDHKSCRRWEGEM